MSFIEGKDFSLNEIKTRLKKMNIPFEPQLQKNYYINKYNEAIQNEENREKIKENLLYDAYLRNNNYRGIRNFEKNYNENERIISPIKFSVYPNEGTKRKSTIYEKKLNEIHFIKESNEKKKNSHNNYNISFEFNSQGERIIIINGIKYKLIPLNLNNNLKSKLNEEIRNSQITIEDINDGLIKMKGENFQIIPFNEGNNIQNNYDYINDNLKKNNNLNDNFKSPSQINNNFNNDNFNNSSIKDNKQFTFGNQDNQIENNIEHKFDKLQTSNFQLENSGKKYQPIKIQYPPNLYNNTFDKSFNDNINDIFNKDKINNNNDFNYNFNNNNFSFSSSEQNRTYNNYYNKFSLEQNDKYNQKNQNKSYEQNNYNHYNYYKNNSYDNNIPRNNNYSNQINLNDVNQKNNWNFSPIKETPNSNIYSSNNNQINNNNYNTFVGNIGKGLNNLNQKQNMNLNEYEQNNNTNYNKKNYNNKDFPNKDNLYYNNNNNINTNVIKLKEDLSTDFEKLNLNNNKNNLNYNKNEKNDNFNNNYNNKNINNRIISSNSSLSSDNLNDNKCNLPYSLLAGGLCVSSLSLAYYYCVKNNITYESIIDKINNNLNDTSFSNFIKIIFSPFEALIEIILNPKKYLFEMLKNLVLNIGKTIFYDYLKYTVGIFILLSISYSFYKRYKEKKLIEESFYEIKQKLYDMYINSTNNNQFNNNFEVGISENEIIKYYSNVFKMYPDIFSKKILPILRKMRRKDYNIKEYEGIVNGKKQIIWQWRE